MGDAKERGRREVSMESVRELYERPKISPPKAVRVIPQEAPGGAPEAPVKRKRRSPYHFKIGF